VPGVHRSHMNSNRTPDALLEAQLAEAEERFLRRSNGVAVCSFTRAGVAAPGLKYAEGQCAALRQVQQVLGRGSSPAAALTEVVDQWTEDLTRRRSHGAGPDWIWYRLGGVDALEQLADVLNPRDV